MTDNSNITPIDSTPSTGPRLAFLNDYPLAAPETDWIVQGRVNKRIIERKMQEMIGLRNRKDYAGLGEQFDILVDGFDKALAGGMSEEDLKRSIGHVTIAACAIASSAMPGAFNCFSD